MKVSIIVITWLLGIDSVLGIYDPLRDKVNCQYLCCLPLNYSKGEKPPPLDEVLEIDSGFVIDDVSDVDDEACAVTLVLIMRFKWKDRRLVLPENHQDFAKAIKLHKTPDLTNNFLRDWHGSCLCEFLN